MMMDARAGEANRRFSSSSSSSSSSSNHPIFTATQWQELEHQALIYKYMVSGVPIPPQLLFSTLSSTALASSSSSSSIQYPKVGWGGYFQVGNGKKGDPEPGRCRRTDGKKWRCSKEANHPNSKYCERHMHRGKNRSRKPVEISPSSSSSAASTATTTNASYYSPNSSASSLANMNLVNPSSYSLISPVLSSTTSSLDNSQLHHINPSFIYPHQNSSSSSSSSSSNRANIGSEFSPQSINSTTHNLFLDPASDKDYRYFHGGREDHNQQQQQLGVSSTRKLGYCSTPQSEFESFYHRSKQDFYQNQQQQEQHCFVLGADFKSSSEIRSIKMDNSNNEEISQSAADHEQTHKPLHHFFGIGGGNCSDSWLDLSSTSSRPS
ncbi:Growth-regulating factor 5 [Linum perenne]